MFQNYLLCLLLAFLCLLFVTSLAEAADPASMSPDNFPWSYSVDKKGVEQSKRVYLLVLNSGEQIQVQSKCMKNPGESRYGKCEHHLRFVRGGRTFILHEGENVLLAPSPFGDIATVTYGCCGSPDSYTFYDYDLQPIGALHPDGNVWGEGIMNTPLDVHNVSNGKMFLESMASGMYPLHGYFFLEKDKNGRIKSIPVELTFSGGDICDGFLFNSFMNNLDSDEQKFRLSFKGHYCDDSHTWSGICDKADDSVKCVLNPIGAPQ